MVVAVGTEMSQELPVDYEIPEDGVCGVCGRLVRGHSEVQRVLRLRGIRYGPYCRCPQEPAPPDFQPQLIWGEEPTDA